jgi:endonuclease/exonuclease/phosphatase family metal-dependent hydrolase
VLPPTLAVVGCHRRLLEDLMHALADSRSRARVVAVAALLLGMVLGGVVLRVADGSASAGDGAAAEGAVLAEGEPTATPTTTPTVPPTTPGVATRFTASSLNVLGADHTAPGGNKRGWASGEQRMRWLTEVIQKRGVDVIGLQEFQRSQYNVFVSELGSEFGTYPGTLWGKKGMRNSVAWRLDSWELVSSSWIKIPYFHGTLLRMPVVLLRNLHTGQQVYYSSFHNPADARGHAEKWRDQATDLEIAMVNRLEAESGLPVYVTGDMNERDEFFCRMTAKTDLLSASGGENADGSCAPTRPTYIDWVLGSPETVFTRYEAFRSAKVRKSTDHPMILAEAELPPAITPPDCPTTTPTPTPTPTGSPTPNVPTSPAP